MPEQLPIDPVTQGAHEFFTNSEGVTPATAHPEAPSETSAQAGEYEYIGSSLPAVPALDSDQLPQKIAVARPAGEKPVEDGVWTLPPDKPWWEQ